MAYNFVSVFGSVGSVTAVSSLQASGTFAVGEYIIIPIFWNSSSVTILSVTDTLGNIYTSLAPANNTGSVTQVFYCVSAIAGSTTITVTWSATDTNQVIRVFRYWGLTGAPQTFNQSAQNSSVANTNDITSGPMTPTGNPAVLFGYSVNGYNVAYSIGNNLAFTQRDYFNTGGGILTIAEDIRLTSNTTVAATFNTPGATSAWFHTYGLVISEAQLTPQGWKKHLALTGIISKSTPLAAPYTIVAPVINSSVAGTPTTYTSAIMGGNPPPSRSAIQWTLDNVNISGATGSTYTPLNSDAGHALRVIETWTSTQGTVNTNSSPVTVGASSFTFSDIGTSGWTIPTPTVVSGVASSYITASQPGSRLMYIDYVGGTNPSTQSAALDQVYFWNGTNIVDRYGFTSPGGTGTLYGIDPLNPSGPVVAFKGYAICAPKGGGSAIEWVGDSTLPQTSWTTFTPGTTWRYGMPDFWLFKRGVTYAMYQDFRNYYDTTGRTTKAISYEVLRTATGASSSARAVIGAYGPLSSGRARIINQSNVIFQGYDVSYQHVFGLMIDGSVRDLPIRPVDWLSYPTDTCNLGAQSFAGMGVGNTDLIFEDVHWYESGGYNAQGFQFRSNYVGPTVATSGFDLQINRCIINDGWDNDGAGAQIQLMTSRASGDAAQSWTASTTPTTLIWPTQIINSASFSLSAPTGTFNYATGVFTSSAAVLYRAWPTMDITANVATNGTLRVSLYQNSTEIDFYTMPGTGVLSTFQCYRVLRMGTTPCAINDTFSIQISTTNGSGTVTVVPGNARLCLRNFDGTAGNLGIYIATHGKSRYKFWQSIFTRNGFNVNPRIQTNYIPDGVIPMYDWNIRNHNWYTVGDADLMGCVQDENVCMLGAAGSFARNPTTVHKNFFYEGYFAITPEHFIRTYTTKSSEFNDNVLQRFRSLYGTTSAHPGWGVGFCGGYNVDALRNIVSDVAPTADGFCGSAMGVTSVSTPYLIPGQLGWRNDPGITNVQYNILDSTDSTTAPFVEENGETYSSLQWESGISAVTVVSGDAGGTTITCTPTPGYTGTPTYQWYYGVQGSFGDTFIVSGATTNTYTLTSPIVTFTLPNQVNRTAHGLVAGQTIQFLGTGTLPTGLAINTVYFVSATGLSANSFQLANGVTFSTVGSGTLQMSPDWAYDYSYNMNVQCMVCLVSGITYPPGFGTGTPNFSNNIVVMPASKPGYNGYTIFAGPITSPQVPATSAATITGNSRYATRAAAATALAWPNPQASLKTHLQNLGLNVSSGDGFVEYDNIVIGVNPITSAMRRGYWDDRLLGRQIGNHVRTGRGMATV